MEGESESLTIKQAAALLGVHPNTVRNRIKAGVYEAEKVITEHGETFMLSRSELEKQVPTNTVPSASQAPLSQPLPIIREVMQSALEPFVRELGEVREELGRERERREQAERRVEELERRNAKLESPQDEQHEGQEVPGPGPQRSTTPEREATGEGNIARPRRSLWRSFARRIFGGG
jgi:excisionase family DNA binding protein